MAVVASIAFLLLRLADRLIRLVPRRLSRSSSSSSSTPRFLGDAGRDSTLDCEDCGTGSRANASMATLALQKLSTASLKAQFPRSFVSWSVARQRGHFPSTARHRRIQIEQNVWLQLVSMGEL